MRFSVKHSISKAACLLGLFGAAFAQTGCAHPMLVQPSVMIQPQVGYPQVYGQQQVYPQVYGQPYGAASMVVMPRMAPQVVYSPPVYRPVYGYGFGGYRGYGHGGHEGHEGHGGFGGHGGWRR